MFKIIALPNGANSIDGDNWGVQSQWFGALRIVYTGSLISCGDYVLGHESGGV